MELLVAVAILGVVTVPLLHVFITSTDTAAKSRTLGKETLAAQNVAETVEATPLGSLGSLGTFTDGNNPPEKYAFKINNISGGKYSAVVTLKGTDSQDGTVYTPMDTVFMQTGGGLDPDAEAKNEFQQQAGAITQETVTYHKTRTISIDITENSGGTYEYSCVFHYTCKIDYPGHGNVALSPAEYSYVFYDGTYDPSKSSSLASLYFFFNPVSSSDGFSTNDTITVTHTMPGGAGAYTPVSVFLAQQGTADPAYRLQVRVKGNEDNDIQSKTIYCNVSNSVLQVFDPDGIWYQTQADSFGKTDLVTTEQQYRRYDMTVELYDDKNNRVYTLTGSKLS